MRSLTQLLILAIVYAAFSPGCVPSKNDPQSSAQNVAPRIIQGCSIDATGPLFDDFALKINAARNETASAVIQLSNLPKPDRSAKTPAVISLKIAPLQLQTENAQIDCATFKAWQILSMPVDVNRAGYVRHTGLKSTSRTMPRALLPIPMDAGKINITGLRDPSEPFKPTSRIGLSDQPLLLWFDLPIPPTAKPGAYATTVEVLRDGQRVESVPLTVNVYNFVLPDDRHLSMVGRIEWDSLEALYPDLFENITPNLISRTDPKYAPAVKLLDQLVALAQEHRTTVVVPRLQPGVKWPANAAPQVDWSDFDTLVEPWLKGDAFADKVPLGYWPLPRTEFLDRYPLALQLQYWANAASHFDQKSWMDRAWVEIEKDSPGRANSAQAIQLSTKVNDILNAHPLLRVSMPLEDAQLQFQNPNNPRLIDKTHTGRIMTAERGLVFAAQPPWPVGIPRPTNHWLRTDLPGLVPYIGAGGDERDVRLWAWLAFLRQSQVIGWDGALPHSVSPEQPADPNDLTWFYPGRWFGVDAPLPSIQLKWLRRAQQDYEYLHLAMQRGQKIYSLVMARLMIKPVQTQPNEDPDPTHGLLSGTTDAKAWTKAIDLLAQNILLREPGVDRDSEKEAQLNLETANWIAPQDKPLQIARNTAWGWSAQGGNWVDLRMGLDIYNGSDQPLTGEIQWVSAPKAWEFNPQPMQIDLNNSIRTYQVKQFALDARVDLSRLSAESRKPIQLKFIEPERKRPSYLTLEIPVAASDKREGRPIVIDGLLGDWDEQADALNTGPLTAMLDRPNLQKQTMQLGTTNAGVYSNWAAKQLYVAFKLEGISSLEGKSEKNFVDYQLRRAWGEDLCEILVQPIYAKGNDVGQIVHIVCKPRGTTVVSTKHSPKNQKLLGTDYREVIATNLRYQATLDASTWRGELAIPWDLINDKDHQGLRPALLRFNFAQHKVSNGESASWAGPVDFGNDDAFMGLLFLRDNKAPGMGTGD